MPLSPERKREYFERLELYLNTYSKLLIVSVDNVGSKQMQQIRMALRGSAEVIMGKNTMMRKVFKNFLKENPGHPFEDLLPEIVGNIGFVFTHGSLADARSIILENKVPAPARVGAISPCEVVVPPGPTGCDPGQTSFFQALALPTKIVKGQIEIVNPVVLLKEGDKVGSSEAVLLQKLNICPFSYGMVVTLAYDNGSTFDPKVLDLTTADLTAKFLNGARTVAALSLAIGFPTLASLPHSVANAYKKLLAITVECPTFSFDKADAYKAAIAN